LPTGGLAARPGPWPHWLYLCQNGCGPAFCQPALPSFIYFAPVSISALLKNVSLPLAALLLASLLSAAPAQAQRKGTAANPDGSLAAAAATPARPARLQPLFGGLSPAQATQLIGAAQLKAIAASFASTAEASTFFTNKGYEYLRENQPDTAAYRFNLAWLLNPQNAEAYRGLGIIASSQATPDAAISLLNKGFTIAPTSTLLMSDLGASYLIRYSQTKKKKDLTMGLALLQRATAAEPTNANAWQQLARGLYYQEKYAEAWDAVHKGQNASVSSLDFDLISDLLAKLPDPQGTFK
jgi:tetratricopeptide (TPR) repeat protein